MKRNGGLKVRAITRRTWQEPLRKGTVGCNVAFVFQVRSGSLNMTGRGRKPLRALFLGVEPSFVPLYGSHAPRGRRSRQGLQPNTAKPVHRCSPGTPISEICFLTILIFGHPYPICVSDQHFSSSKRFCAQESRYSVEMRLESWAHVRLQTLILRLCLREKPVRVQSRA